MVTLFLVVIVIIIVATFSVQNAATVSISFLTRGMDKPEECPPGKEGR